MITKTVFIFLLAIHTLIHLVGVSKSFHTYGKFNSFYKSDGLLWLLSFVLLLMSGILFLVKNTASEPVMITGIILSQVLIIMNWKEAKYGTILNILLCAAWISGIIN